MQYEYTDKQFTYEQKLYRLILNIEKEPGLYIGEPSITKLFFFISGYGYAIIENQGYRLHFDKDFQMFINKKTQDASEMHWNNLLCEGRTEQEAFHVFFSYFGEFLLSQKL